MIWDLIFYLLGSVPLAFAAFGTYSAIKKRQKLSLSSHVGVSILRPVKGLEPGFEENLISLFEIDYQKFEILIGVADRYDPSIPVIEKILSLYPSVSARLLIGETEIGPNPKINNLWKAYQICKYDTLLVSDSNIRINKNFLKDYLPLLFLPHVGVVSSPIRGIEGKGLGGWMEGSYLNGQITRYLFLAEKLRIPFLIGKNFLFSKSQADRFGGFLNLRHHIAEDFTLAQAMRHLGLKIYLTPSSVDQYLGNHSILDYWRRHLRWGRIRRSQVPLLFFLEPFNSPIAVLILSSFFQKLPFGIFQALALFCCDTILFIRGENFSLRQSIGWWIREILVLPLWFHSLSRKTVVWRGRKLNLGPGGTIEYGT